MNEPCIFPEFIKMRRSRASAVLAGKLVRNDIQSPDLLSAKLGSLESIDNEKRLLGSTSDGDESARILLRLGARLEIAVSAAEAELCEFFEKYNLSSSLGVLSSSFSITELEYKLKRETAQCERAKLLRAIDSLSANIEAQYRNLWDCRDEIANRAGWPNYRVAQVACKRTCQVELLKGAHSLLKDTEAYYYNALNCWAVRVIGCPAEKLTYADLDSLRSGALWKHPIQGRKLKCLIKKLVKKYAQYSGGRIHDIRLDLADRIGKSVRPHTAALRVPGEIRLVGRPCGTLRDIEELLHEMGHCLAFSSIEPSASWEDRLLWFDDVGETYAYLFASLSRLPSFLVDELGMPLNEAEPYCQYAAFVELLMVRRYAAKLIFECENFDLRSPDCGEIYADLMRKAIGLTPSSVRVWREMDSGFYTLDYFRAWVLEAGVRAKIRHDFGEMWYERADSFHSIGKVWRRGGIVTGEELASKFNFCSLSCCNLINELQIG